MDCSLSGSSIMGFSRWEYWSGLLCLPLGDLPHPGIGNGSLLPTVSSPDCSGWYSKLLLPYLPPPHLCHHFSTPFHSNLTSHFSSISSISRVCFPSHFLFLGNSLPFFKLITKLIILTVLLRFNILQSWMSFQYQFLIRHLYWNGYNSIITCFIPLMLTCRLTLHRILFFSLSNHHLRYTLSALKARNSPYSFVHP